MASFHSRRKAIKNDAIKILFSDFGAFLRIGILVLIIVSGISNLSKILMQNLTIFPDQFVYFGLFIYYAIILFVLSPYVINTFSQKKSVIYKDFTYSESLKISVFSFFCVCFVIAAFLFIPEFAIFFIEKVSFQISLFDSIYAFLIYSSSLVLIFALCAYINSFFLLPFCKLESSCFFEKLKHSTKLMKGKRIELLFFNLSFIPLFLSVYFTFGITFVFVLPYYLVSLCLFALYVIEEGENMQFALIYDMHN